jgi:NAD(P)-dependent dehydrogenase (short-subunit alcohol dehydrogenase family)
MRNYANSADNGQIINIVDTRITNNKSEHLSYSLSKKSLWELTQMAALELAPNFRVNAIAPGAVLAPVGKNQNYLEMVADKTPMKSPSGVISVLKSIDYIIENKDLTGQLIYCDGGAHLM